MSEIKVSQLATASSTAEDDYIMLVQNGVSKKISIATLLKNLNTDDEIRLNPLARPINISISSKDVAGIFKVDGLNNKVGINTSVIDAQAAVHVGGVARFGSSTQDGIVVGSEELINNSGTPLVGANISLLRETSALKVFGTSTYALSAGFPGQTKYIYISALDNVGATATITVTNGFNYNTILLNSAGSSVYLKYVNAKWVIFGNNGAILS